jgi:hypothetical protein
MTKLYLLQIRKYPDQTITVKAFNVFEARAMAYRSTGRRDWISAKHSTCKAFPEVVC